MPEPAAPALDAEAPEGVGWTELEAAADDTEERPRTAADRERLYEALLSEALLSGEIGALSEVWSRMLVERADLVELVVRRYAQRLEVRRHIVTQFTPAMYLDVVRVLDREASRYVSALLERPDLITGVEASDAVTLTRLAGELREHALAYLVLARGVGFEPRSYVESLLRRLALAEGIGYAEIL
ncbi:uncharacterized protein METZ01_LOCUS484169, partial [marine metagenome]